MEWTKDRTMKLIELLQLNARLWNTALCDTRKDKQKRKEELRIISETFGVTVSVVTKKIQHLRTQYNRESVKETRHYAKDPNEKYISSWYAFEYLHFIKDSTKPYRILEMEETAEINDSIPTSSDNSAGDGKVANKSPVNKPSLVESQFGRSQIIHPFIQRNRDEFSVFGEYVANELRSLKGEKDLLVTKKKIQDVIFDVKMQLISEVHSENSAPVYVNRTNIQGEKVYSTTVLTSHGHVEPLSTSHSPTSTIGDLVVLSNACHYPNYKVDDRIRE